jgi:hypothetical protein
LIEIICRFSRFTNLLCGKLPRRLHETCYIDESQPFVFGYNPTKANETVAVGRDGIGVYRFRFSLLTWIRKAAIVNTGISIPLDSNQIYTNSDEVPSTKVYDHRTGSFLFSTNQPSLARVREMIIINNGEHEKTKEQVNE